MRDSADYIWVIYRKKISVGVISNCPLTIL